MTTTITSTEQDYTTLPMRAIKYNQSNRVRIQFLRVSWGRSSVRDPTIDAAIFLLNAAMSRTKGEVERRFTSQDSYNFIPSTRAKQWFHQSGRSQSGVWLNPVQSNGKVGLDCTTDYQSWTGRARSGPAHTHLQIRHCFIVKYHWKHDSSSHLITTHLWIPALGEIMTVLSVYSVPSRYISPIKSPIQWEIYPNPGHSAELVHASPVQSSPGPTDLWTGPIPVQKRLGLDWTKPGLVQSGPVHPRTGGIIGAKCTYFNWRVHLQF